MSKAKNIFTATAKCLSLALTYVCAYSHADGPEAALTAAGAAALGAAAMRVLGNAAYDLINKTGIKPGEVLLLQSQVDLASEALRRALGRVAERLPEGEGAYILRDHWREAERRWRELVTGQIVAELNQLTAAELKEKLTPADAALLVEYLTKAPDSEESYLDDAALTAIAGLLVEEYPAALLDVLTEPEGEKLYKLDLLGLVSGNRALFEELLRLVRGDYRPALPRVSVTVYREIQSPVTDFVGRETEIAMVRCNPYQSAFPLLTTNSPTFSP